ncbi:hypothetical protein Pcinc_043798 [Petrolisthes cinctipes]|uniref:Uncharacterized protein n=1 Tax=Petrolisthes cinctipes TaxID=88211 RepID=A0AAE1BFC3_PETCI|nr:hypothetical protein Pcinc_043798 [Petrolisthes cinctipes]
MAPGHHGSPTTKRRLSKWLPQQDILGHPKLRLFLTHTQRLRLCITPLSSVQVTQKLRLFITHGGLLSLQEATYHGFLSLASQSMWIRDTTWKGSILQAGVDSSFGRNSPYDRMRNAILEIIDNKRFREGVAEERAIMMRDQPVQLLVPWANYWVEYVIRHQGADTSSLSRHTHACHGQSLPY